MEEEKVFKIKKRGIWKRKKKKSRLYCAQVKANQTISIG